MIPGWTMRNYNDDPSLFPSWKQLVNEANQWDYGSFHTHEEIAEILGFDVKTSRYYQAVKRADIELLTSGRHLEVIQNKGYYLINPDEFVRSSNNKVKKSARFFRHGILLSQHAPRDKMNPSVRKNTDDHTIAISRAYSLMTREAEPLFEIEQKIASRVLRADNPKRLGTGESK